MPLRQYVYFALSSSRTSAQVITEWLGIEPDETTVRGSRRAGTPTVPVTHRWKIVCREPGMSVDEQIARILDRLRPHTDRIAEVAARLSAEDAEYGAAALEVVRCFNDEATGEAASKGEAKRRSLRVAPVVVLHALAQVLRAGPVRHVSRGYTNVEQAPVSKVRAGSLVEVPPVDPGRRWDGAVT